MRARSIADLKQRRDAVKAQAERIGNFRPEDEIALAQLLIEREDLDYLIERAHVPGRPFARREDA